MKAKKKPIEALSPEVSYSKYHQMCISLSTLLHLILLGISDDTQAALVLLQPYQAIA